MKKTELQNTLAELIDWDTQDASAAAEWVEGKLGDWSIRGDGDYQSGCGHPKWFISQDQTTEEPYCEKCQWEVREAWYQQQLASTKREMADAMAEMSEYCSKELTAAEEQLAEMAEILTRLCKAAGPMVDKEWWHWPSDEAICEWDEAIKEASKALSAAPKRGRVQARDGWAIRTYTDKDEPYTTIELAGPPLEGYCSDGQDVTVTVREAE